MKKNPSQKNEAQTVGVFDKPIVKAHIDQRTCDAMNALEAIRCVVNDKDLCHRIIGMASAASTEALENNNAWVQSRLAKIWESVKTADIAARSVYGTKGEVLAEREAGN